MSAAPKVLKAGSAASDAQTTYNFIDLRQRCDSYVEEIRLKCRGWVEQARAEADAIRQEAYDAGRREGRKDGLADAAAQIQKQATARSDETIRTTLATALPAVEAAAGAIARQRETWTREWEEEAIHLTLAVAERLTRVTLADQPVAVENRVREAISLAAGTGRITVHLAPADFAALTDLAAELSDVEFRGDDSLSLGDCVVSTGEGLVDGRLQLQLKQIERELLD